MNTKQFLAEHERIKAVVKESVDAILFQLDCECNQTQRHNIGIIIANAIIDDHAAAQARITELETSLENLLSVHPLHPHAHQDTQDAHEKASNALRKETA